MEMVGRYTWEIRFWAPMTALRTGGNALDSLETARVAMNGELYLPKGWLGAFAGVAV